MINVLYKVINLRSTIKEEIMSVYTMIVIIVALGIFGDVMKKRNKNHKCKAKELESDMQRLIEINERLNDTVKNLQTRVANLETIVTQEGYDLKNKINSL